MLHEPAATHPMAALQDTHVKPTLADKHYMLLMLQESISESVG